MVKLPKKFSVGEKIFAKVRGYPPWPAKIDRITDANTKNAKYHVTFYGTKEVGICKLEDLYQYAENKEKFTKPVKRKPYVQGIQELEEDLKRYPNPSYTDSSKDSESAENIPENVDDPSEKESETTVLSSIDGEGDNEAGNLVIDEGDKKRAVKRKAPSVQNTPDVSEVKKKRGRKSMATILAENAALKQDAAHDSQDEDSEKKVVSRSGRKIKPKRFHDFSDAEIPTDPSKNEDDRKAQVKDEADIQHQNRLSILRIESQIMFLDTQIRSSLGLDQANADECLEAMNQLYELQVTPFMLKKYSPIVETIKRLRRYVGNLPDWKLSEEETATFKEKADQIKKKAELIYNKFKTLFTIPEGRTFWETFTEQVDVYKQYIKNMTPDEVYALLTDPTETAKPGVESSADLVSSVKSDTTAESAADKNVAVVELDTAE